MTTDRLRPLNFRYRLAPCLNTYQCHFKHGATDALSVLSCQKQCIRSSVWISSAYLCNYKSDCNPHSEIFSKLTVTVRCHVLLYIQESFVTLLSGRAHPHSIVPFPWPCFQDYKYKTERIMRSTIHIAKLQRVQNGANGAGYTIQFDSFYWFSFSYRHASV